jgi:hypothetical protein
MAKIDVEKEKINFLKLWLGVFIVSLISLFGWVATNYTDINLKLILGIIAIIWLMVSIHLINKSILKRIENLKDL